MFREIASHYIEITAEEIVTALLSFGKERYVSVLDSGKANDTGAKILIVGFDPFCLIESLGDKILITENGKSENLTGDVLKVFEEKLSLVSHSFENTFAGGCIATLSYDFGLRFEEILSRFYARQIHDEPDTFFAFYDTFIIHDYSDRTTQIVSCGGQKRIEETYAAIKEAKKIGLEKELSSSAVTSNFTREEYEQAVNRIKEHIAAGDIYQANLTQKLSCKLPYDLTPDQIFLRLRRQHPAPFGAFIQRCDDTVISASPERFLRVKGREIEACPIKGTRPRGKTFAEDKRFRDELLTSEKDRAENVMIVDLLRNDIGRICEYGSVTVDELCVLHEHPTLFHLVSTVRGILCDGIGTGDLLRATFPCGSITGAPKIRAMEIIDSLEPNPRGLSMGAIGYFSFNGSLDLNVAIRTMTVRDGIASFNVGGGIVADSIPANEYEETLVKAKALMRALNADFDS